MSSSATPGFVHLHNHSSYSLRDAIQAADGIGQTVASRGMTAVALTDHGYMGGVYDFVRGCKAAKVKPIIGNETYLAFGSARERVPYVIGSKNYYSGHFLLLAKNMTGYQNLLKLTQYSYDQGFYGDPRIDLEMLSTHSEGLMATSTCLASHMSKMFQNGDVGAAKTWANTVIEILGRDNFFLEVQCNQSELQARYNHELIIPLSQELKVPLVLTADAHYTNKEDWYLRGLVQCIGFNELPHKLSYGIKDHNNWLYDAEFALELCRDNDIPEEAVSNTVHVANKVEHYFDQVRAPLSTYMHKTEEQMSIELRTKALEGIKKRFGVSDWRQIPTAYIDRLKMEINTIDAFKYNAYFLTVEDYISMAREKGIVVGPARGSGGGSLLAWALGITGHHMDPIKNNLYFERFLNPGRVSIKIKLDEIQELNGDNP